MVPSRVLFMVTVIERQRAPSEVPEASPSFRAVSPDNVARESSGDEDEVFVYPGAASGDSALGAETQRKFSPSPAQLESIFAAASSGDLPLVKKLFKNALEKEAVESFGLANDASPRTGTPVLHAAAGRGYLDIVSWLINDCGAMVDLEDREGETALHKAALNGYLEVVKYLIKNGADVHAQDADGWTALHNACSKGYLDIVRWICENGGATLDTDSTKEIDIRSKDGWTPLMNASSKGHLPVVHYLLSKQFANPLIRNKWGETAYDSAAAVFEVWICEVLAQAEAERWRRTSIQYNPFAIHTTVPLILYEFQKLDTRLKTVAVNAGRPKFSISGLGHLGRRSPFELRLPIPDSDTGHEYVAAWRDDVQLPLRVNPWILPKPQSQDTAHDELERSHFWLSDWTLDITHPNVDIEEGWQYAHSFEDSIDQWTAGPPPQLARILTGSTVVKMSLNSSGSTPGSRSPKSPGSGPHSWVRRRRWVRIMRRRLDIPPLPFLELDGSMYQLDARGTLVPYKDTHSHRMDEEGQELGTMPSTPWSSAQDYVARSKYLIGSQLHSPAQVTPLTTVEARRAIHKLERATTELRQGILCDDENERRTQAEVLLNTLSRELDRRRLEAGAQGLLLSGTDDDNEADADGDDDDDEKFCYPGSSFDESEVLPTSKTSELTSCAGVPPPIPDLTPQLSLAPEFRVPTHEVPQKNFGFCWTTPVSSPEWEKDMLVQKCRECQRRFNLLLRRHHCRRCGRIFCDNCSSYKALLDPSQIAHDPVLPVYIGTGSSHRVCRSCFDAVNSGPVSKIARPGSVSLKSIVIDQTRLTIPSRSSQRPGSKLNDLVRCPVCDCNLEDFPSIIDQELHVKMCLEDGTKYLVYSLPAESTLLGIECVICLDEFVSGSTIARLSCFCSFHNACLSSWLQRGKSCPVHGR